MFPVDFPAKDHRFERRLPHFSLYCVLFDEKHFCCAWPQQIEGPAEWWDIIWVCPKSGYSYPKVGGLSLFFAVQLPVLGAYSMDPKMNAPSWGIVSWWPRSWHFCGSIGTPMFEPCRPLRWREIGPLDHTCYRREAHHSADWDVTRVAKSPWSTWVPNGVTSMSRVAKDNCKLERSWRKRHCFVQYSIPLPVSLLSFATKCHCNTSI